MGGKTNKRKGSDAERYYAKFFRELGYPDCSTARFESKHHDNAKIDLMNIPFNIQVKAGKQTNMSPGRELFNMESAIKAMFREGHENHRKPLLLFHYKAVGPGHKRQAQHEVVYMSLLQFDLFKAKSRNLEYDSLKTFRYEMHSQFKQVVGMTLEVFKSEVILKQYSNVTHSDQGTSAGVS